MFKKNLNGIVVLDKPIGLSSNAALQRVKKILNAKKAGHTGSLDVLASGVLPLCFGEATKFSQYLLTADKSYYVTAKLGQRTTTCDAEGEVFEIKSTDHVTQELIDETLEKFRGEQLQIPSMFSALKHQGKPLYFYARQGIEIEREPRSINVYELKQLDWKKDELSLSVQCSKGTYIRNLVDDIGQVLGCGAYVTVLRRFKAGPFTENDRVTLDELEQAKDPEKFVLPIEAALPSYPILEVTEEQSKYLSYGREVILTRDVEEQKETLFRLIKMPEKSFIGLGRLNGMALKAERLIRPLT